MTPPNETHLLHLPRAWETGPTIDIFQTPEGVARLAVDFADHNVPAEIRYSAALDLSGAVAVAGHGAALSLAACGCEATGLTTPIAFSTARHLLFACAVLSHGVKDGQPLGPPEQGAL